MTQIRVWIAVILAISVTACFRHTPPVVVIAPAPQKIVKVAPKVEDKDPKDKFVMTFARIFEQADSIHREAWWVISGERRPVGKSPFGKVQRALLSSQNVKLANKSAFRCDRYIVNRNVMALNGYPQKADLFEKCSEKIPAKRMAVVTIPKAGQYDVTFFPDGLEEILGIGASIVNKQIDCRLIASSSGALDSLACKNWIQDRSKEQQVRLDSYDYKKEGKDLIKLRGKVYENLTDTRKIEADVPMTGKILVTETELYPPPEEKPTPTPKPKVAAKPSPVLQPGQVPSEADAANGIPAEGAAPAIKPLPPIPLDENGDPAVLGLPPPIAPPTGVPAAGGAAAGVPGSQEFPAAPVEGGAAPATGAIGPNENAPQGAQDNQNQQDAPAQNPPMPVNTNMPSDDGAPAPIAPPGAPSGR